MTPAPHLLILIHSLRAGGAERVAVDLAGAWLARGFAVTVVTQRESADDAYVLAPGVQRVVLGLARTSTGALAGLFANLRRVRGLRRLLRERRPTIVLGMMTTASVLAVLAATGLPCRVIASEHTHPPAQRLPVAWRLLRRWTYPRAHAVVALTRATAHWLRTHVPGSTVQVIPNAVTWPLPVQGAVVVPPPRQGRRRVLAVGRLHPVKGFDRLIAAFARLARDCPQWDLVILGEGAERAALQAQIAAAGLAGRIALPGRVGNMADWYAQSDLYVLSSRVEGLSNTLLEAMAAGLPVLAVDCDVGPREIIRDGVNGRLVSPPDDPAALAAAMAALMRDARQRETLAAQAQAVRARYAPAAILARWEALLS